MPEAPLMEGLETAEVIQEKEVREEAMPEKITTNI